MNIIECLESLSEDWPTGEIALDDGGSTWHVETLLDEIRSNGDYPDEEFNKEYVITHSGICEVVNEQISSIPAYRLLHGEWDGDDFIRDET